ncbi:unnamed protein product [Euphydryas editha]|uniref:PiggyBac transposable element-derived protein domain-containing protein n=1 Tax=Euphydryas editha TaxID=104508 RepID=A0AAU9UTZ6_EUPED|nr:unnamed protein product [Euphydryas editha]
MSYEEGQRRLLNLFDEAESDFSVESDSDIEIDNVSKRSYESETEQELDAQDEVVEESTETAEYESEGKRQYFTGKDGTKWSIMPERSNVRTRSENIIREKQGVKKMGQNAKTVIECWQLFFTDEMLHEIVIHTNSQINLRREQCQNSHAKKYVMFDITVTELKAFICLLYLSGRLRSNKLNLKDLWRSDGSGVEIFRTTMTQQFLISVHSKCLAIR